MQATNRTGVNSPIIIDSNGPNKANEVDSRNQGSLVDIEALQQHTALDATPEDFVDIETPSEVQISPQGTHVVYTLKPGGKKSEHKTSALWIAEVGKQGSYRRLTDGLSHDRQPRWSPDGKCVAFLSDRAKHGTACAIYVLSIWGKTDERLPRSITRAENEQAIEMFKWSLDGNFVAFLSADEVSEEQKRKTDARDDAKVYGEDWKFARLRLLDVKSKNVDTLVSGDFHVANIAWRDDSKNITYLVQQTPDRNSPAYHGVHFDSVSLSGRRESEAQSPRFPRPVNTPLEWQRDASGAEVLYFLAGASHSHACTSTRQYSWKLGQRDFCRHDVQEVADMVVSSPSIEHEGASSVFTKVELGLTDCIYNEDKLLFRSPTKITTWDMVVTESNTCIIALVTSTPIRPLEVYSFRFTKSPAGSSLQPPATLDDFVLLSSHSNNIAKMEIAVGEQFDCEASDGQRLNAVFMKPKTVEAEKPCLPTVVLIHGGPYSRSLLGFEPFFYGWTPYLLTAGYGVLLPNYRGGSGNGEEWAAAARGGMGRKDYSDVVDTVKAAIEKGLVHPEKVVVAGWSQGGFLSYLCTVRDEFKFKGAICGAGVTDWDMLCMTSDFPWFEVDLTGKAPWATTADDVNGRHGSAVWHMHTKKEDERKTPVLILHGEKDERVPVTQAIAFYRGCLELKWPCEFVVYPREEHMIAERNHLIDMMKRVRCFCDVHLS
jgi:dipeptidyl aminopeptidase/acylaminoacyl peptidase